MTYQRVMELAGLGDGDLAQVIVTSSRGEGVTICLARHGMAVYAVQHNCSHADYPLADGSIQDDCQIECMLHGAVFDLRDGTVVQGPATEALRTYPTKVEDDGIWVDVG